MTINVCYVHFRGLSLLHLDASLFSLSKAIERHPVRTVHVLDNASGHWPMDVEAQVRTNLRTVPVSFQSWQQPDVRRTHSWTVNHLCRDRAHDADWIFFLRSDYIVAFDVLEQLASLALAVRVTGRKPFVSGWCWQMGIDEALSNIDAHVDIERYGWRTSTRGLDALQQHPYAHRFHQTQHDAGVWLTRREYLAAAGWMNEAMTAWGYQQSTFQRALGRVGVSCDVVPDYLFAHQHHYAERDFVRAQREYQQFGGGV